MKPARQKLFKALARQQEAPPPRTEEEKRATPAISGSIQMGAGVDLACTFQGDTPGHMRLRGTEKYRSTVIDPTTQELMLYTQVTLEVWVADKVCNRCNLTLPVAFVQTYSGTDAVVDAILGIGKDFKHYHMECEPSDPQYKFKLEYGAIQRQVYPIKEG